MFYMYLALKGIFVKFLFIINIHNLKLCEFVLFQNHISSSHIKIHDLSLKISYEYNLKSLIIIFIITFFFVHF